MSGNNREIDGNTTAWTVQVWASFAIALFSLCGGILLVPVDYWIRGYLLMGTLFTVGSTFNLSKTVRDNHEYGRLRNRIQAAKTDKILKEFELNEAA